VQASNDVRQQPGLDRLPKGRGTAAVGVDAPDETAAELLAFLAGLPSPTGHDS
jgi:hypothetical protein